VAEKDLGPRFIGMTKKGIFLYQNNKRKNNMHIWFPRYLNTFYCEKSYIIQHLFILDKLQPNSFITKWQIYLNTLLILIEDALKELKQSQHKHLETKYKKLINQINQDAQIRMKYILENMGYFTKLPTTQYRLMFQNYAYNAWLFHSSITEITK
tara:strand:+ start:107 stop:568 length:462 start_codon:yes stop_codon:yes gene_type:complete